MDTVDKMRKYLNAKCDFDRHDFDILARDPQFKKGLEGIFL